MNALEVRKASTKDFEFLASLLFLADQDRLAGRDGWILKHDFIKYAFSTDLCKDNPHDRVFYKYNYDEIFGKIRQ